MGLDIVIKKSGRVIQPCHTKWKNIFQASQIVQLMLIGEAIIAAEAQEMLDRQASGRIETGKKAEKKIVIRLQKESDLSLLAGSFRKYQTVQSKVDLLL